MPALIERKPLGGMVVKNTPIDDYVKEYGLWVKREDLSCPPPGPPFSKSRGVYAHLLKRPEKRIGVLDTSHSQAGWAVARACQVLGKKCINFYPVYRHERDDNDPATHELRNPQIQSRKLGAELYALPAGRSCILYHRAKKLTEEQGGYMMPNALKLDESVTETAAEVPQNWFDYVLIAASSGTIAAGVIKGFWDRGLTSTFLIHLGYKRSVEEVERYLRYKSRVDDPPLEIIDEGYAYADEAKPGPTPPWPCNRFYDLKSFRWFQTNRKRFAGAKVLFWNIG